MVDIEYPEAKKISQEDNFHGTIIADPYRWMEDPHDPETVRWMKAQNELVENYIDYEDLDAAKDRLGELYDYTRYTIPQQRGNKYFYTKNTGLQPQSIYYVKAEKDGEETVLFDPNELSEDGTTAVNEAIYSEDGKYVVFAISVHGSDWMHLKIMDTETKEFLDEKLENVRNFAAVNWKKDNSGFYYSAFVGKDEKAGGGTKVWWHDLNTPQTKDDLVFEHPEDEAFWVFSQLKDNKYLFVSMSKDTMPRNNLYFKREGTDEWIRLHDDYTTYYGVITVHKDIAYLVTNENAENYKIISIDLKNPDQNNWKTIIEENEELPILYQGGVLITNNQILVNYINDVVHKPILFDYNGNKVDEITLPTKGSALFGGRKNQETLFVGFTSTAYPMVVFEYDFDTNTMSEFFPNPVDINPDLFKIDQVFYDSNDGTQIPMFIIHKPEMEKNGKNETILYGYGGFSVPVTLGYSQRIIHWVEQGGIFAIANLRGGGEYGEKWHKAGMLENKQNVFDDFIAAGEYLIESGYTSTPKLATYGGSNGGLLTAATMLQRPDLFGAVITSVGVLDMLRFHKYTIGHFWVPEYGNPEDPDHFEFMIKYSPLHNVEAVEYPPTFVTSADTDDRVDPSHSRKYVATLQEKGKGGPLLLRMVIRAGHGAGKPIPKVIEDIAYQYAFLKQALNK